MKKLKHNKSAGIDGIRTETLKIDCNKLLSYLVTTFTSLFFNGSYPEDWSTGIIVPIFKKGDPNSPSNYRGVTLVPILDKLYSFLLHERTAKWAEENEVRATLPSRI